MEYDFYDNFRVKMPRADTGKTSPPKPPSTAGLQMKLRVLPVGEAR